MGVVSVDFWALPPGEQMASCSSVGNPQMSVSKLIFSELANLLLGNGVNVGVGILRKENYIFSSLRM